MRPIQERYHLALAGFIADGWTETEWLDLFKFFQDAVRVDHGGHQTAGWLIDPRHPHQVRQGPARVRDLFDQYGPDTHYLLRCCAAGIPERFVAANLGERNALQAHTIEEMWGHALIVGLTEVQAIGWSATGYLAGSIKDGNLIYWTDLAEMITDWTARFGPDAWLYVLAGITVDEAVQLKDTGTEPTEQQLRVMVALAGHILPAGA